MTTPKKKDKEKDFLLSLQLIVGKNQIVDNELAMIPYLEESRRRLMGQAKCVVLPQTVDEVSQVVAMCRHHKVPIICQGGNTGRNLAAQSQSKEAVILNLKLLNKIRSIDLENQTVTVEAGCILAELKDCVAQNGLYFPLALGAEASCQIGGNLATNAGGLNVLRYGNTRDLVMGIEVVGANGQVMNALKGLRKDNTGYDLKNLFIGSEGTLGVITAATLKLYPKEIQIEHGFVALKSIEDAVQFLHLLQRQFNGLVSCFELIPRIAIDLLEKVQLKCPVSENTAWYVWYQLADTRENQTLLEQNLQFLEIHLNSELIADATVSQNERMAMHFFKMRETLVELGNQEGIALKFDIALPISNIATFVRRSKAVVEAICPDVRFYPFGHLGDGNLHYNIIRPHSMSDEIYLSEYQDKITTAIYDLVDALSGSFSAEHGVGCLKLSEMRKYKDPIELDLMHRIKHALDPMNIMNPGKVLPTQKKLLE